MKISSIKKENKIMLLFAFITACFIILICSKSSPLYPFNDWVDANCFLTVGKSMLNGLVPYRDLVEQKGPLLYMLHAITAMISRTTFLGVYFLEVIAATIFLFFSYKILSLYSINSKSCFWIPIIGLVTYSSAGFCHGDSAEELCLPLMVYAIYAGLKSIKQGELPSKKVGFVIGITSACILWIKFSMLGFYIGWFLVFLIMSIKKKQIKKLFNVILFIILGVFTVTIPILIYFFINNAVDDLIKVYFYNNLFLYPRMDTLQSSMHPVFINIINGIFTLRYYQPVLSIFSYIIIGYILIKKRGWLKKYFWEICFVCATSISMFVLVYIGGRNYPYYTLIFSVFTAVTMIPIAKYISNIINSFNKTSLIILNVLILFICCIIAYGISDNTYLLKYKKEDMPQYKFANIINKKQGATLLNYGFLDGGFYTVANIIPNCKYFCGLNIFNDEMKMEQQKYIENGEIDFIVTLGNKYDFEGYKCISEASFYNENVKCDYYLYEKEM